MKLKLALIFSVLVVGFILFAPASFNPLKDKVAVIDKVEQNIDGLKNGIDNTIDNIGEKFDNVKDGSAELFSDKEITGEQESEIAEEYTYYGEATEDEQVTTQDETPIQNDDITPQDDGLISQEESTEEDTLTETTEEPELINNGPSAQEQLQTKLLKTLQLTTTQEDNGDVKVQYSDNSGNTISVKFTLKNSERELFSGTFYASNFETSITDISNTDHIIEMIVEHKEFGTITSSVYKPAGNLNSMINGVFMTP
ncbi:MAG: hypothetical protein FJ356_00055 [Thaumarchaeota archaeon]|nr:hypothetical protein [Nitrososphaerota archaeon]